MNILAKKDTKATETVNNKEVAKPQAQEEIDLKKENEKLKKEFEQLKEMFSQLIQSQNSQNESNREQDKTEAIEMLPTKLIHVTSLFHGGMTLRGSNNKPIRFERFGLTRPVTFEDLTYICSNHRTLAEEGSFFIHSKEAIELLYLESNYKKIIDKSKIENLITLPHDEIEGIFSGLTDSLKETIEDIVINGIISNDTKYLDRGKIDFIGKLCGKNLYKIAQDRITE